MWNVFVYKYGSLATKQIKHVSPTKSVSHQQRVIDLDYKLSAWNSD